MRSRERDLEALHEIAVASSGILDPDELGRLVMDRARELLGGDEATLLWWDAAANSLRILGDTYVHPFPRAVAVGEGAAGIAFQRGETVVVEDYPNWPHRVEQSLSRGLKSAVAVPLMVRSTAVGVLSVSFNSPQQFAADDLRFLSLLATQVAPALEAARLHDKVVQVSQELEHTNEALQDANRHKSAFLAHMSHELRTPLNSIIGFSELLTDAREGQFDDATRKRFLSQILNSGRHLLSLINDILDLSKVEAGQMELKLQVVSIAETVDQVARTVEPLAAKKKIRVETDASGASDFVADPGKLKQMLLNLVSNAIKFTPEGGRVTIRVARSEDNLEISVADTGIGIAEADQAQIFTEFHQVDAGPGRRQEGTGLGLALTQRFARLHGGDVSVKSRLNEGSTFTIRLPGPHQATRPPVEGVIEAAGHPAGPGSLVLVVEDEAAAAELLTRQLARAGYRIEVARTGSEALAKARELQPAAITLDVVLPELDGWEVITRLKSDEATSGIPIVVVSVIDNPQRGMALGAIDYFVKPIDTEELVRRLRMFDGKRLAGPDKPRVLVVDDDDANLTWLTHALEPAGFAVVPASGGREAIDLAKSGKPDLVLLDLMMPEVNGFDVVEALRADEATRDTPIMVLTAANLTEADKRMLNGRVSSILSRSSVGASDIVDLLSRVVPPGSTSG